MNLFLIGNGFDLAHHLPTKYENFLHTINFLIENYTNDMQTIGSILGNSQLHAIDTWISKCYQHYSVGWNEATLHTDEIENVISKAKFNMWFSYLLDALDQDLGWIDFEKEISFVIEAFSDFLAINTSRSFAMELNIDNESTRFVISRFDFFHDCVEFELPIVSPYNNRRIKDKYCIESPKGSGIWIINKDAVINELYCALEELAFLLKEYLRIFIEQPLDILLKKKLLTPNPQFQGSSRVITFNYSTVFEKVYGCDNVVHIHGTLYDRIVLGVNPNADDEVNTVDTSFLKFKKYYQRVRFGTDISYLSFIEHAEKTKRHNVDYTVTVIGHSLDVTDKDIVTEIFNLPSEIIVFYHNEKAIDSHIKNLVTIYGKSGFDHLRLNKKLRFQPLDT